MPCHALSKSTPARQGKIARHKYDNILEIGISINDECIHLLRCKWDPTDAGIVSSTRGSGTAGSIAIDTNLLGGGAVIQLLTSP